MLVMLHHDCAYNPTESQLGMAPGKKNQPSQKSVVNQAAHIAFLEEHPLEKISDADLDLVGLYMINLSDENTPPFEQFLLWKPVNDY